MESLPRASIRRAQLVSGVALFVLSSVGISRGLIDFSPAGLWVGVAPSFFSWSSYESEVNAGPPVNRVEPYSRLGVSSGWSPRGDHLHIGAGMVYFPEAPDLSQLMFFENQAGRSSYLDLLSPAVDGLSAHFGVGWRHSRVSDLSINMDLGVSVRSGGRFDPPLVSPPLNRRGYGLLNALRSSDLNTSLAMGLPYKF